MKLLSRMAIGNGLKTLTPKKSSSRQTKQTDDWRAKTLSKIRQLIKEADPEVVEEVKWKKPSNPAGIPVWSHDGIICTGETYKDHVKMTFAKGASLKDPDGLFNASLEGKITRAIDVPEGERINEDALRKLIQAAVTLNQEDKVKS